MGYIEFTVLIRKENSILSKVYVKYKRLFCSGKTERLVILGIRTQSAISKSALRERKWKACYCLIMYFFQYEGLALKKFEKFRNNQVIVLGNKSNSS